MDLNTKMTAAELEKLLAEVTLQLKTSFDGVLPVKIMVDEVGYVRDDLVETLARKVIAAEKLVEALFPVIEDLCQRDMPTPREVDVLYKALTAWDESQ